MQAETRQGSTDSYIVYYAEIMPGGRAIMRRDVVVDGELVNELSGIDGSPARMETVKQHERRVSL